MSQPAPPLGRPTQVVTLGGGTRVRVTQALPRKAFRIAFTVLRSLGRSLVQLLVSKDGMVVDIGDGPQRIAMKDLWNHAEGRHRLIDTLFSGLEEMDTDRAVELMDLLVVGQTEVWVAGQTSDGGEAGAWVSITSSALMDEMIPDALTLVGVLRAAAEVTLLPFASATGTPGATSKDETSEKPAATK